VVCSACSAALSGEDVDFRPGPGLPAE
jgi:hypothetical protein